SETADSRHYGLCHGDVVGLNMLYDNGHIWVLDFELGCYCWRCYDFSVLLMCDYLVPIWQISRQFELNVR
ncbi:MAG: phosphotransferase, partial [Cyanobacteria bacterium J06638_22]